MSKKEKKLRDLENLRSLTTSWLDAEARKWKAHDAAAKAFSAADAARSEAEKADKHWKGIRAQWLEAKEAVAEHLRSDS